MKKLDTMRLNVGRFTSFSTEIESFPKIFLYSMKIKVLVDETDEVSSKHGFEVVDETDEVSNHIYGKATLTWFEEIFEEY
ncbi:N-ethylammeline chlorohydrolase [Streptococcus pneumoniae]|nr:N-ethylammeline chlorohydrolase [Streptococcus pneumoniae]CWE86785.1 N-ethylammeline chlorohydrolase [Streptococcus pneumoniae]VLZ87601.1 N-ethylammeline chlorohydrolase [Streptococcus pneumoniae]